MLRNDSAWPELPFCGSTLPHCEENPTLSPARSWAFSSRTLGTLGDGPYLGLGSDVAPYGAFLSLGVASGLYLMLGNAKRNLWRMPFDRNRLEHSPPCPHYFYAAFISAINK